MFTRRVWRTSTAVRKGARRHPLSSILTFILGLGPALFLAQPVRAQISTTATISGTVSDPSGAAVAGAKVTVMNENTGVTTTTQSNADGSFVASGLPVGNYKVSVVKEGFRTFTEEHIVVHPATVTNVTAVLQLGQVSSEISVVASAQQVQTATSEVSSQVSEQQVETLPLNGRNYQSLSALMPGVTNTSPGSAQNQGGFLTSNTMSINGMGQSGTLYTLDGIWNMNTGNMTQTTITPNPDTIQEVRVLQNNYSVQYSIMGANVVLLQTKSGTDQFHGSLFEYLRNDALDARNFFSPTVPPLKQNIFGGTIGGPIKLHRSSTPNTFFFYSLQFVRQHIASTVRGADPTEAMRNGDFSFDCPAGFNASGICSSAASPNIQLKNPATGLPFPNNQIPSGLINSSSLALLNAKATLPNNLAGGFQNFINLTPQINTQHDDEIRVDHNFGEKYRLMAEYLDERQLNKNPNETFLGSPYTTSTDPITTRNQLAQIQLTATLSPSMVNTVAIAMNNYVVDLALAGITQRSQVPDFNEVLPFEGGFGSDRLPQITFAGGWAPLGVSYNLPLNHASDLENTLSDDWSWLRGAHYIQAGMNIVFGTKRQTDFATSNGNWFFDGSFSGDPIADYLLGQATSLQQASTETRPYVHYKIVSPYVQDRWKVTRKLTLTVGIRPEYVPVPHPQIGYETVFDPTKYDPAKAPIVNLDGTITPTASYDANNGLIFNGLNGVPLNFADKHKWVWSPQIGFAYDIFGDGKTALRGGYGITYNRVPTGTDCSYFCGDNPPRVQSITLTPVSFPNSTGGKPAPPGALTLSASEDLNLKPVGMLQTYSLSIEHQFGSWITSLAGAGNIGHNMGTYWDRNQPFPVNGAVPGYPSGSYNYDPRINFDPARNAPDFEYYFAPYQGYAGMNTNVSLANARWNALEVNVRHPVGSNLFLSAAYTWQHGLSDTRGLVFFENNNTTQDIYHPRAEYGTSNLNAYHILSVSYIWSLPWYQNAKGIEGAALGGWKYSGIATIQSGFAQDAGLSVANQGIAKLPDRTGTAISGSKTVNEWFNTAAFAAPAFGFFGSAGTGSIMGPGLVNFDMAFYKTFRFTERQNLEFRAELFNIFNHTNFNALSRNLGAGDFGKVTSARDPRIVEFALRYHF